MEGATRLLQITCPTLGFSSEPKQLACRLPLYGSESISVPVLTKFLL